MSAFDHLKTIPRHIAVIMDGNGRWALQRQLPRREGHRAGAKAVERCIDTCARLGVEYLTLYAFSSQNWKRPAAEVSALMTLLAQFLKDKIQSLMENNVRLQLIGEIERLPPANQKSLARSVEMTAGNTGLTLVVALSYGSREEILRAAKMLMEKARNGGMQSEDLDEASFAAHLYTHDLPDPDLLIRTSGEYRLSNFLLWQLSYAEIHITDVLWPDFAEEHLLRALEDYQGRQRRFGEV